jgi:hypothetical protein
MRRLAQPPEVIRDQIRRTGASGNRNGASSSDISTIDRPFAEH